MNSPINTAKALVRSVRKISSKSRFTRELNSYPVDGRLLYMMGLGEKHPNLGDQAQAAVIPLWLEKHFSRHVIQLKSHELEMGKWDLRSMTSESDIVFMHSGGNFGDDWYGTQLVREAIVSDLRHNVVIQLPQTVHYSSGVEGNQRLARSQEVFNSCDRLMLFGRDKRSAELAAQYFPKLEVRAKPDMVLSLQSYAEQHRPNIFHSPRGKISRVLLIMRNDKEGVFSNGDKNSLLDAVKEKGYVCELWDTDVKERFPEQDKLSIVMRHLDYIGSFDAVITDRYHGLIFSVLTKKPCVVLPTHNHKLTSAFDWFDKVNFVVRTDSPADAIAALRQLEVINELRSPDWNSEYFDPMAAEVKEFLGSVGLPQ